MQINPHAFEQYTIAFYNLENLFDYRRNPRILDAEFTPSSRRNWNKERYQNKINKLADAISKIGFNETGHLPDIIGVAEVENEEVLDDLIAHDKLAKIDYAYIHYHSPDERGIDVALIYNKKVFKPTESAPITIHLYDDHIRDTTRDILYVEGKLAGTQISLYVNHWPSRRRGELETNTKRIEVAEQLIQHVNQLDPDGRRYDQLDTAGRKYIISLGDYNDDPEDDSVAKGIIPHGFKNHFDGLKNYHRGSVNHQGRWYLFDQIITSQSMDNDLTGELYMHQSQIFDDIMLRQWKGKIQRTTRTYLRGKQISGRVQRSLPGFHHFKTQLIVGSKKLLVYFFE